MQKISITTRTTIPSTTNKAMASVVTLPSEKNKSLTPCGVSFPLETLVDSMLSANNDNSTPVLSASEKTHKKIKIKIVYKFYFSVKINVDLLLIILS